jgi:hypothetical protein
MMKHISKILVVVTFSLLLLPSLKAEKFRGLVNAMPTPKAGASCLPATNSNELTINNVSAYLETDGNMWFREVARYEVPKGSGKTSMFAAALWIGGRDVNQQLKVAAVTFNQRGHDFWTGPLTVNGAAIDQQDCQKYDRFFKITRAEVERHIAAFDSEGNRIDFDYVIPASIRDWYIVAHGDVSKGQSKYLAPFKDVDGDEIYDPEKGDYPYYDLNNELCPWTIENIQLAKDNLLPKTPEERMGITKGMIYADHVLKGDETLYWIINDKGNVHTESQGDPIGLEIRGQAFGFATNNELNNMTFYSYEIINRSTYELTETFFSQWVDPDLGYANDDYVGCDVLRGLGYCYNGKDVDGTGQLWAYGSQPPAVGVDFFQGPYLDPDNKDNPKFFADSVKFSGYCEQFVNDPVNQMAINGVNFGDDIVDNERYGMRRFVYHDNNNTPRGDPRTASGFYNMLRGIWGDNTRMTYGGNAWQSSSIECDFMFPGLTDPCNWGTQGIRPPDQPGNNGWTEMSAGNEPYDRRFMQSAGPFTLKAGAVNYITVGIPWARASQGGAWASVELLKIADDKCQKLFENCFKVLDGPDAPDVTIRELENELIIYLTNDDPFANNYNETYTETDNQIEENLKLDLGTVAVMDTVWLTQFGLDTFMLVEKTVVLDTTINLDRQYRFEGYIIYQLLDATVSVTDLDNPSKAQVVAQCDIDNEIGTLTNWIYNDAVGTDVATQMVVAGNKGIVHSFSITEDVFAPNAKRLVNHKPYYFMVIAYAHNQYYPFTINSDQDRNGLKGQKTPFLAGRKNIKVYTGIPHKAVNETINASYGTQPEITRMVGQGNGGYILEFKEGTIQTIMDAYKDPTTLAPEDRRMATPLTYKQNAGPLDIKVVDPLNVKPFDYIVEFYNDDIQNSTDVDHTTKWRLKIAPSISDEEIIAAGLTRQDTFGGNPIQSALRVFDASKPISAVNEQLFLSLGLSISIKNYDFQIHQEDIHDYYAESEGENFSYVTKLKHGQVDLLSSSVVYDDPSKPWLGGVQDEDVDVPDNWIRSGSSNAGKWDEATADPSLWVRNHYYQWKQDDAMTLMAKGTLNGQESIRAFSDPRQQFENIAGKTWAPYPLVSGFYGGPQARYMVPDINVSDVEPEPSYYRVHDGELFTNVGQPGYNPTMNNIYSVDIVLTKDKSKWTRCVVLEACDDRNKSEGGALIYEPRKHKSVDKEGNTSNSENASTNPNDPNYISAYGMGWFPGYAINIETGERLNIMFSENSSDPENNGADMLFNPTSVYAKIDGAVFNDNIYQPGDTAFEVSQSSYNALFTSGAWDNAGGSAKNLGLPLWGGKHFVYIMNSVGNTSPTAMRTVSPPVDYRSWNDDDIPVTIQGTSFGGIMSVDGQNYSYYDCGAYDAGKWLMAKFSTFKDKVSPVVADKKKKMQLFNNVMWTSIVMPAFNQEENWMSNDATVKIRVSRPYLRYNSRWFKNETLAGEQSTINNGMPTYEFSTKSLVPSDRVKEGYKDILSEINIVPNPYYAYSTYESSGLDNYVKIVNLPNECTVSVFTMNGTLVRKMTKGDASTSHIIWDLKNNSNIPIASGMYIIRIDAPGIGQRTLKFLCVMRPLDLNTF